MTDPLPQPGLFDDPREVEEHARQKAEAAREAERAAEMEWNTSPQACPICGHQEPSGWLVRNNHGVGPEGWGAWPDGEHPIYGHQCLAQNLVTGHLRRTAGTDSPHLDEYKARGRELGLDVDQIIADAQRIFHDHQGTRIPAGHTVMRIENHYPRPHIVNIDMEDADPHDLAEKFAVSRQHEIAQTHTRDGDVFTIHHPGYSGVYQRVWWETAQ